MRQFTNEEDDIIRHNFGKIPAPEIVKLLPGRTVDVMRKRATRGLGLVGNKSYLCSISKIIYSFNHQFFSTPNIICSYWAGFIAADGCVTDNHSLNILLARKDRTRLEMFADAISFNGPIADREAQYGPMSTLSIHSALDIINDLHNNYMITPRKSLTLQPPVSLDRENSIAFIVGYIDGDGSIQITKRDKPRVFIRGTEKMLTWIKSVFDSMVPKSAWRPAHVIKSNHDRTFYYTLSCGRFIAVAREFLALPIPFMERKWSLVRPFV